MRIWLGWSAIVMAGLWGPAHAQVYKCKGAAGEAVYSQNPCGGSAEEVKVRTSRAATRTAGEVANRDAVFRSTDLTDIAIAERNCIASASSSIYGPVNARAADYQRQISALSREAATAKNNLAGATYQAAVRSQISGIQGSMSAERQTADSNMTSARQRCADERRSKEEGVKKAYEARASQPAAAGY